MVKKPKPVNQNVVCSECGQPWDKHTDRTKEPTLEDCVAILKAALLNPGKFSWIGAGTPNSTTGNIYWGNTWGNYAAIPWSNL